MSEFDHSALAKQAQAARQNAYAPYSLYPVGSALLTTEGTTFSGASVENACIAAHICGPQGAFLKAVSEGHYDFVALAIATRDGDAPCGVCRQMINEFGADVRVLLVNENGNIEEMSFSELMSRPFSAFPV